jgi:hypothetical protein
MDLKQKIELLHRSSNRMMDALSLPRDVPWWNFMRREAYLHLKRSFETWWHIITMKK